MANARSTITTQGRTSVPAEVRRKLGIRRGSILEWIEDGENVIVRKAGPFTSEEIRGALFARPPRARSLEQLKEGVRRHARRRHAGR
jgi:AbrB family looped-hinge helix DNA binding protein